ncbi:MAG: hypothetical protein V1749_03295 [Candidatus Desantisbacteria bacterium]
MSVMEKLVFDSNLLSDGHLYCPKEIIHEKNAHFKVVVTFDKKTNFEASEYEIELSGINDVSNDFLSEKELNYYLNLETL